MSVSAVQFVKRIAPRRTVREPLSFTVEEDKRFFSLQIVRIALARKLLVVLNAKARDARKELANAT